MVKFYRDCNFYNKDRDDQALLEKHGYEARAAAFYKVMDEEYAEYIRQERLKTLRPREW
jgi:hypothetical protein